MDSQLQEHLLRDLRDARATALRDAEAFDQILFVVERLGSVLYGGIGDLGKYRDSIIAFAQKSPLGEEVPAQLRQWHTPFPDLYSMMQEARNDALHQGACARHLTTHAIQIALILEDAMAEGDLVRDYMVNDVVQAYPWQPISFIRQQMLTNSFTYLPVYYNDKWGLLSDFELARYLRPANSDRSKGQRKLRLMTLLSKAIEDGVSTSAAVVVSPMTTVEEVLKMCNGQPVLVTHDSQLMGIVSPFDLL